MLTETDVREMLIQHILTEEIFTHVFNEDDFHRENNIAKQLYALEGKFFTGATKRETLKGLEPYYATIRSTAALITDHGEKQQFLKAIYEGFYKVYNPKAADQLGVVYTPNEIVRFMIEGADWLTQKHFSKALINRDVESSTRLRARAPSSANCWSIFAARKTSWRTSTRRNCTPTKWRSFPTMSPISTSRRPTLPSPASMRSSPACALSTPSTMSVP